jgi:DNA-binding protein H-NS
MAAKDNVAVAQAAAEKANAAAMEATRNLMAAQKERAKEVFTDLFATFKDNVEHFGKAGRRQIRQLLDKWDTPAEEPAKKTRKNAAKKADGKKAPPKFKLPDGDKWQGKTWTGRGKRPILFNKWSKSAEGKAYLNETGQEFPPFKK